MRVFVSRSHGTDTGLSTLLIFAIQTVTLPSAALPVPQHRWQDLICFLSDNFNMPDDLTRKN